MYNNYLPKEQSLGVKVFSLSLSLFFVPFARLQIIAHVNICSLTRVFVRGNVDIGSMHIHTLSKSSAFLENLNLLEFQNEIHKRKMRK